MKAKTAKRFLARNAWKLAAQSVENSLSRRAKAARNTLLDAAACKKARNDKNYILVRRRPWISE